MQASECKHSRALPPKTCLLCSIPVLPTLHSLALNYLCDNFESCCCQQDLAFKPNVFLTPEICYRILMKLYNNPLKPSSKRLISIFQDKNRVALKKLTLRNSGLVDEELRVLLEYNLQEIELIDCPELTCKSFELIKEYCSNLSSVAIRDYPGVGTTAKKRKYGSIELPTERLKQLKLQNCPLELDLSKCQNLTFLELSSCQSEENYKDLGYLLQLQTLILYDFFGDLATIMPTIAKIKTLTSLDISTPRMKAVSPNRDDQKLLPLLIKMKNIKYLEVGGRDVFTDATLPIDANWNYLGVYNNGDFCRSSNIPALIVGGHSTEEQLLVSAINLIQRPLILKLILVDLVNAFKYGTFQFPGQAMKVCLDAINYNLNYRNVVLLSVNLLGHIFKKSILDANHKYLIRHLLITILTVMNRYRNEKILFQNCCNLLMKFNIPEDTLFEYEKFVEILLQFLQMLEIGDNAEKKCAQLLNAFACNAEMNYKIKLGQLGVITVMCQSIRQRAKRDICDQVLDLAWATVWNLTDETPFNCQEFLKNNGLTLFFDCYHKFQDDEELYANMIGLLGNIAEVPELRPQLLTRPLIKIFTDLLMVTNRNNVEVSYGAASIIAYLASDGTEAWTDSELPARDKALNKMALAIDKWDLKSLSGINYNSLRPLYRLIKVEHTPQCRYWGAWALANLAVVYPERYCEMIIKDRGLEIMQGLLGNSLEEERVKQLAQIIINSCEKNSLLNR